jgi:hypothetical protein
VFGDIVVTYERMQEVEFSFFTLPDSGAFITHAPRRLSEALALVYPFQREVWPALIFTVLITGPILYFMIVIPEWLLERRQKGRRGRRHHRKPYYNIIYIREITMAARTRKAVSINSRAAAGAGELNRQRRQLKRDGLFARCVWFTCHIFLRQCSYPNPQARNSNSFKTQLSPSPLALLFLFSLRTQPPTSLTTIIPFDSFQSSSGCQPLMSSAICIQPNSRHN